MKLFLSMFAACVLALVCALLAYDLLVAQPRETRMQAAMQDAIGAAADAGLAGRREQAAQVAAELDASLDRSIASARDAMAQDVAAADARARIADGLARASAFKLAVTETYMTFGRWPQQAAEAGLSEPGSYAVGAVRAIALEPDGVIEIRYTDAVAAGAVIRLLPTARADMGSVEWRCEAMNFPDRSVLPTTCR